MAKKAANADFGFREADARGKGFVTAYYSADLHKGAQALPPFVAAALAAANAELIAVNGTLVARLAGVTRRRAPATATPSDASRAPRAAGEHRGGPWRSRRARSSA